MKKESFGPKQLLGLLISSLLILFAVITIGLIYVQSFLNNQSKEIATEISNISNANLTPQSQLALQQELDSKKSTITKIGSLYSSNADYQNTSVTDITKYASKSGIVISSKSFTAVDTAIASARTITLSFDGSVKYENLIKFLTYIEKTTPKMQVSNLKIGRSDNGNSNEVKIQKLVIAIYVR
jgi:predicted PurR-regulated permease PerM